MTIGANGTAAGTDGADHAGRRGDALALTLLGAGLLLWIVLLALVLTVLLHPAGRAALAGWIDDWQLALPWYGTLRGEVVLAKFVDKMAMLSLAIIPVLLLETAICGLRDGSLWRLCRIRSPSAVRDLVIYGLNLLGLWRYAGILLTFGAALLAGGIAEAVVGGFAQLDLRIRTGSLVADTALAFVLFTFCDYWNHRLQHRRPLWQLHRIHHSAEEMTVLSLWRAHPSVSAVEPLFKLWPLALFDIPAATVAVIAMIVVAYEHLIHSNIRWDWGWFGRWVLVPPMGHRLHHNIDPTCQGRNFGIPVLWDRLFGTWDGGRPPDDQLGVAGVAYHARPLPYELWRDLVEFLGELRRFAADQPANAASIARRFRHWNSLR